jgi:K+-sensing histidine kinase KdpD
MEKKKEIFSEQHAAERNDVFFYTDSAWFRVRFAILRSFGLLVLVYLINALMNMVDIGVHQGLGNLVQRSILFHALFFDEVLQLEGQATSVVVSLLGILALAILLVLTAQIRYRVRKNRYREQLRKYFAQEFKKWQRTRPDAALHQDIIDALIARALDVDAPQRIEKIRQIEEWFEHDTLFMEWTAFLIQKRNFRQDVMLSILLPSAAIIFARIVLLLK